MPDPGDIPEPGDELFVRVKKIWGIDAVWPRDSEGDAGKLADAWDSLGNALKKVVDDGNAQLNELRHAWQDLGGLSARESIHNLLGGTDGTGGIQALADQSHKLAAFCRDYAKKISDIKGEIIADVAINVGLFALSFALAGPAGEAFFASRFGLMIAARMAQFAKWVDELSALARFGVQGGLSAAVGSATGGLGNLAGQEWSNLRGYGPLDWGKVGDAARNGAIAGAVAHSVYQAAGRWVAEDVTRVAGNIPRIPDRVPGQIGNTVGMTVTGAVTGAIVDRDDPVGGAIAGAGAGGLGAAAVHGGADLASHFSGKPPNTLSDLIKPHGGGNPPSGGDAHPSGGDPHTAAESARPAGSADSAGSVAGSAERAHAETGAGSPLAGQQDGAAADQTGTRAADATHLGNPADSANSGSATGSDPGHEVAAGTSDQAGGTAPAMAQQATPPASADGSVHSGVSENSTSAHTTAKPTGGEQPPRQASTGDTSKPSTQPQASKPGTAESKPDAVKNGEQPGKGTSEPSPPEKPAPTATEPQAQESPKGQALAAGGEPAAANGGPEPGDTSAGHSAGPPGPQDGNPRGGSRNDDSPGGPRGDGSRDDGPRDGGPRDGGPRDGGPRDTGPRGGGPRNDSPRSGGPLDGGPRDDGPQGGPAQGGGPHRGGRSPVPGNSGQTVPPRGPVGSPDRPAGPQGPSTAAAEQRRGGTVASLDPEDEGKAVRQHLTDLEVINQGATHILTTDGRAIRVLDPLIEQQPPLSPEATARRVDAGDTSDNPALADREPTRPTTADPGSTKKNPGQNTTPSPPIASPAVPEAQPAARVEPRTPETPPAKPGQAERLPQAITGQAAAHAALSGPPRVGDPVRTPVGDPAPLRVGDPAPTRVGDPPPARVGDPAPTRVGDPAPTRTDTPGAAPAPASAFTPVRQLPGDFPWPDDDPRRGLPFILPPHTTPEVPRPLTTPEVEYPRPGHEGPVVTPLHHGYPADAPLQPPVREWTETVPMRQDYPGQEPPTPPVPAPDENPLFDLPGAVRTQLSDAELTDLWALVLVTGVTATRILEWLTDKAIFDRARTVRDHTYITPYASLAEKLRFLADEREEDRPAISDRLAELNGRQAPRARKRGSLGPNGSTGIQPRYGDLAEWYFANNLVLKLLNLADDIKTLRALADFFRSPVQFPLSDEMRHRVSALLPSLPQQVGEEYRRHLPSSEMVALLHEVARQKNDEYLSTAYPETGFIIALGQAGTEQQVELGFPQATNFRDRTQLPPRKTIDGVAEFTFELPGGRVKTAVIIPMYRPDEAGRGAALRLAQKYLAGNDAEKPYVIFSREWQGPDEPDLTGLATRLPGAAAVLYSNRSRHRPATTPRISLLHMDDELREEVNALAAVGRLEDVKGLLATASHLAVPDRLSTADTNTLTRLLDSPDEEVAAAAAVALLALDDTALRSLWLPGRFGAPRRTENLLEFPVSSAAAKGPGYRIVVARPDNRELQEFLGEIQRYQDSIPATDTNRRFLILTGEGTSGDRESLTRLSWQLLATGFDAVPVLRTDGQPSFETLAAKENLLTKMTANAMGPFEPPSARELADWAADKALAVYREHLPPAKTEPPEQRNTAGEQPATGFETPSLPRPRSLAKSTPPLIGSLAVHTNLSTVRGARQKQTAEDIARSVLAAAAAAADVRIVEKVPFPLPSDDAVVLDGTGVPFVFQVIHVPNFGHGEAQPITFQVYLEAGADLPVPHVVLRLPDWLLPDTAVLPMAHAIAAGRAMATLHARNTPANFDEQHLAHDIFPGDTLELSPTDLGYVAQIVALGREIERAPRRDRRRLTKHMQRLLSYLGLAEDQPHSDVRMRALAGYGTRIRMNLPPEARDAATAADSALITANRYRPAKALAGFRPTRWPIRNPAAEIEYRIPMVTTARRFNHTSAVEAAVREHIDKAGSRAGVKFVPVGPDLRYDVFQGDTKIFTAKFHALPDVTLESTGVSVNPGTQLLSGYLPSRMRPRDIEEVLGAQIAYGTRYFTTATDDPHAHTLHRQTDVDSLPQGPIDRAHQSRIELLGDRIAATPGRRPLRRQHLISQLRGLLEKAGLEKQLPEYAYRVASLDSYAAAVTDKYAVTRSDTAYLPSWFTIATTLFNEYPATLAMGIALTIGGAAAHHPGNGIAYLVYGLAATVTGASMARGYDIASDAQAAKAKKWLEIRAAIDKGRALADAANRWRQEQLGQPPEHGADVPTKAQLQGEQPDIAPSLVTRYRRFTVPPAAGLAAALVVGWPLGIAPLSALSLLFVALATGSLRPLTEGMSRRSRKGAELEQHDDLRRQLNSYDIDEIADLYRQIEQAFAVIERHFEHDPWPDTAMTELIPGAVERPGADYDVKEPILGRLAASSSYVPYVPDPIKLARSPSGLKPVRVILDHFNLHATVVAFDLVRLALAGSASAWAENRLAVREVNAKLRRLAMQLRAEREAQLPGKTRDRDQLLRDIIVQALRIVATNENAEPNAGFPPFGPLPPELDRLFHNVRANPPRLPDAVSRKASASRWSYWKYLSVKSVVAGVVTTVPSWAIGLPEYYWLGGIAAGVAGVLAAIGRPFHRTREILVDDRSASPVEDKGDRHAAANRRVLQQILDSGMGFYREKYGENLPEGLAERISRFVTANELPTLPAVTPLTELEPVSFTDEQLLSGEWTQRVRAQVESLRQAVGSELHLWGFRPTLERRRTLLEDELPRVADRVENLMRQYESNGDGVFAGQLSTLISDYLRTGEGDLAQQVRKVLWQHESADLPVVRELEAALRHYEDTHEGGLNQRLHDVLWHHGFDRDRQLIGRIAGLLTIQSTDDQLADHVRMVLRWYYIAGEGHLGRQVNSLLRHQPVEGIGGALARLLLPFEQGRPRAARLAVEAIRELNDLVEEYKAASDPMRFTRLDDDSADLPDLSFRTPAQLKMDKLAEELKPSPTVLGSGYLADSLTKAKKFGKELFEQARLDAAFAGWPAPAYPDVLPSGESPLSTVDFVTARSADPAYLVPFLEEEVPRLRATNPKHGSLTAGINGYLWNCVPATSAFCYRQAGWDTSATPERSTLTELWRDLGGVWQNHSGYDSVIAAMAGRRGAMAVLAVISRGRQGQQVRHVSAVVVSEKTGIPIFVDPQSEYATKLPDHPEEIYLLPVDLAALKSMKDIEPPPDGLAQLPERERTTVYEGERGRAFYDVVRQSPFLKSMGMPALPPLPEARGGQANPPQAVQRPPVFGIRGWSKLAKSTRLHSWPAIDAETASRAAQAKFLRETHPDYARPNPGVYGTAWRADGTVDERYLAYWFGGKWFDDYADSYDQVIRRMVEREVGARALMHVVTSTADGVEQHHLGYVAYERYGVAFYDRLRGGLMRLPEHRVRISVLHYTDAFLPWYGSPRDYDPPKGMLFQPPEPPASQPVSPGVDLRRHSAPEPPPVAEPAIRRSPGPVRTPGVRDVAHDPFVAGVDEARGVRISLPGPRRAFRPPMRQGPHPQGPDENRGQGGTPWGRDSRFPRATPWQDKAPEPGGTNWNDPLGHVREGTRVDRAYVEQALMLGYNRRALVWRTDRDPLFRHDDRPPEAIFNGKLGFTGQGTRIGLAQHLSDVRGGLVATTRDLQHAITRAMRELGDGVSYVYEIYAPGGVDVTNMGLGDPIEAEVAFVHSIDVRYIRNCLVIDRRTGVVISHIWNPHFSGDEGQGKEK
ncbi:WXG100-like domain-containing protein [Amycolatopsis pigmentata]|uniref:Uncharacterized protein n=1 Tax=Amycolatopsis pigmentata TaxID=450801 RepID=A0ABW5FLU5_9PSEU